LEPGKAGLVTILVKATTIGKPSTRCQGKDVANKNYYPSSSTRKKIDISTYSVKSEMLDNSFSTIPMFQLRAYTILTGSTLSWLGLHYPDCLDWGSNILTGPSISWLGLHQLTMPTGPTLSYLAYTTLLGLPTLTWLGLHYPDWVYTILTGPTISWMGLHYPDWAYAILTGTTLSWVGLNYHNRAYTTLSGPSPTDRMQTGHTLSYLAYTILTRPTKSWLGLCYPDGAFTTLTRPLISWPGLHCLTGPSLP
jgi:hypothetical protein